jgi:hypothetical protein
MSWFSDYSAAKAIDVDMTPGKDPSNEEAFNKMMEVLDAVREYMLDRCYLRLAADMDHIMWTLKEDREKGIIPK